MMGFRLIARLLAGVPVDPAEVEALANPSRAIAEAIMRANGHGPMAGFEAALAELLPDAAARDNFRQAVLQADPYTLPDADGAEPNKPRFAVFTAADALQPQPPIEWIVERLISAGSLSVVVGDPGSKKTWALLDLAVCVALGRYWLELATCQGPVLIVDEESGRRRLGRRLQAVLAGHGAGEQTPLFFTCLSQLNLTQAGEAAALQALIIETGARLVIIDALADVLAGADENSVKDTQPVLMSLRAISETTQAAIVLIHHSGKAGGYRGSSAISGAIDLMLKVESEKDSTLIRYSFEKARDAEPFTFAADAHFEPSKFWLTARSMTTGPRFGKAQRHVLRHLAERGPATVDAITDAAEICSASAARQAVYTLAYLGMIHRTDAGGRGQKAVYELTDAGQISADDAE